MFTVLKIVDNRRVDREVAVEAHPGMFPRNARGSFSLRSTTCYEKIRVDTDIPMAVFTKIL